MHRHSRHCSLAAWPSSDATAFLQHSPGACAWCSASPPPLPPAEAAGSPAAAAAAAPVTPLPPPASAWATSYHHPAPADAPGAVAAPHSPPSSSSPACLCSHLCPLLRSADQQAVAALPGPPPQFGPGALRQVRSPLLAVAALRQVRPPLLAVAAAAAALRQARPLHVRGEAHASYPRAHPCPLLQQEWPPLQPRQPRQSPLLAARRCCRVRLPPQGVLPHLDALCVRA